jgi:hypothetical protein
MEAELLREMIADREARMEKVRQTQLQLQVQEERLRKELSEATDVASQQMIQQQTERTELLHDQQAIVTQLEHQNQRLQRQSESLQEYVDLVVVDSQQQGKKGRGSSGIQPHDTSNVTRLQAQLCKAMHSVSITDRQRELIETSYQTLTKWQKEVMAQQAEEQAHLERAILNDLMAQDNEVRMVENEWKGKLNIILEEMEAIREQLADYEDSDDDKDEDEDDDGGGNRETDEENDDDDEEELDEEEKAAKEEMMKILQDRRAEIKKLEAVIEEQEEQMEELQHAQKQASVAEATAAAAAVQNAIAATEANAIRHDNDDSSSISSQQLPMPQEAPPPPPMPKEAPPPPPVVDEMEARLQQVMASMGEDGENDVKVDDVDEMDLLRLAQSRLTGGPTAAAAQGEDEEESEEDDDEESETETSHNLDESEFSESHPSQKEEKGQEKEEYDPTEKKEDPICEASS